MSASSAGRHDWAVALLELSGAERVLEIGFGHGIASGLISAALTTGHLTAIDRSPAMAVACRKRNAAAIAAGRLDVVTRSLEDTALAGSFDKVLAVNVDLPLRRDPRWAARLGALLVPGGLAVLVLEAPAPPTAERFSRAAATELLDHGFTAETLSAGGMVAVRAIAPIP